MFRYILAAGAVWSIATPAHAEVVSLAIGSDGAAIVRALWNELPLRRRHFDDQAKILLVIGLPEDITFVMPAGATEDQNAATYADLGAVIAGARPAGAKAAINFGANRVLVRWAQTAGDDPLDDGRLRGADGQLDAARVRREGRRLIIESAHARAQRRRVLRGAPGDDAGLHANAYPTLREWKARRLRGRAEVATLHPCDVALRGGVDF